MYDPHGEQDMEDEKETGDQRIADLTDDDHPFLLMEEMASFCHEGVTIMKKHTTWTISICSHDVEDHTLQNAVAKMRAYMVEKIRDDGYTGC